MKLNRLLMVAALAFGVMLKVGIASAAVVNDSGYDIDMGTVSIGQEGTIAADHDGSAIINKISGILPSGSMITFTYNFAGDLLFGWLGTGGDYSYTDGTDVYTGYSFDVDPSGFSSTQGALNGSPSAALAMASAQIDLSGDTATAVIKNFSAGVVNYTNLFAGLIGSGGKGLDIAYSVSAVPVPAALPLFGMGLGALAFGARRKKKNRAGASAA